MMTSPRVRVGFWVLSGIVVYGLGIPTPFAHAREAESKKGTHEQSREWMIELEAPVDSAAGQAGMNALMGKLPRDAQVEILDQTQPWAYVKVAGESIVSRVKRLAGVRGVTPFAYYRRQDHFVPRTLESLNREKNQNALMRPLGLTDWLRDTANDWAHRVVGWLDTEEHRKLRKDAPAVNTNRLAQGTGIDPLLDQDWALRRIRVPAQIRDGAQVTVAVVDTGVDYNHEDLQNAMWRDSTRKSRVGRDFIHRNDRPYDIVHFDFDGYLQCMQDDKCAHDPVMVDGLMSNPGHGTHCAGQIGAVQDNGAGASGLGKNTQIMALKVFHDAPEKKAGLADTMAIARAIDYAILNGARVINMSLGMIRERAWAFTGPEYAALVRARDAGVLVVVAAGNDSIDQDDGRVKQDFPAAFSGVLDNVIAVAATDENDALAEFSNYGGQTVQIAAPGVRTLSTVSGGGYADVMLTYNSAKGGKKVITWDGTSFAAPLVAGAAARIWSEYPSLDYREVRLALMSGARHVAALEGKVVTGGVLDVTESLQRAQALDTAHQFLLGGHL